MKVITKTEWNMTHTDCRKSDNGQHYIIGYDFDNTGAFTRVTDRKWIPVRIRGVKQGERY